MNKIKVYMFAYLFPPEYTGASIQAISLAKKMRENGIDVTFITATPESRDAYKHIHDGFKVIRLSPPANNSNLSIFKFWLELLFLLIRHYNKYNIIHTIGIFTEQNILAIYGKILHKKTLVKTTLSSEVDSLNKAEKWEREKKFNLFALKKYDRIVGISKEIVSFLINANFNKKQIVYIPNGVDLIRFNPPCDIKLKNRIKKDLNLPSQGVLFSYIGVLHQKKKIDWLIKHWLKVFKNEKKVFLLIAGPLAREKMVAGGGGKEYADYLLQLVEELQSKNKIFFRPFKQKVEDYFKISDYFINPSEIEGLSNALLEAMACGAVPIISRTSGSEDVVIKGYNGYMFDISNSKNFISTLSLCLQEHNNLNKMSSAAQKTIRDDFGITATCNQYIQLYKSLLKA